ncbi:MAG: transporter [Oscillospiraceae bacterium]|nr:transporter [Oscillospiraceae bacterium]
MKKWIIYLEKVAKAIEIVIALVLLVIVVIKIIEVSFDLTGFPVGILTMEFAGILSVTLNLVIGVEFTKMLIKHTPESVVDVLLFAIARQMVVYHERTLDLLIGVLAIAGLFAIKKVLLGVNLLSSWKDIQDI